MAESRDVGSLAEKVVQGTDPSPTISATPAGPTDRPGRDDLADTINQVFALFRLNYHNQFYAAYADTSQLSQIKRLWLEALGDFTSETILSGAKRAIEDCDYLPTLKRMLDCCRQALERAGIPDVRSAFIEACGRGSPKLQQPWTHPVVYLAGRDSNWFFLANNPESVAWPVFREHYQRYCVAAMRGETLEVPAPEGLEHQAADPLPPSEQLSELRKLREESGL